MAEPSRPQAGMSSPSPSGASSSSPGNATFKKQKKLFLAEFNTQLYEFVLRLLPTNDELAIKEDVRKLLEKLIRTIEPDSRLMAFGSTANGFSLRNSDMDLCCLIDGTKPPPNAGDLVQLVGDLLERETKFAVKTLPHARIPIIKLSLAPSPGLPFGIACDIGFENRLALENTRMLHTYASLDPARVRTMVLFLKVWSKRRKINSPYEGTLSSYGYVLLVIYFLLHVKSPPVLPNIQQIPPPTPRTHEQTHHAGNNIWFFDDIDTLRHRWQSQNTQSVAELLVDLFRYYSRDFPYNSGVASIRVGPLSKAEKGWTSDFTSRRDGNRLCIEDPFETEFNVGRCVTKEGLYLIRGEFMRASRILGARPDSALLAIAQLCAEREESPEASSPQQVPPAPPYTVGARPGMLNLPTGQIPPTPSTPSDLADSDAEDGDGRSTSDLSVADDASIASAPMHHQQQQHMHHYKPMRIASSSGADEGAPHPGYAHHHFARGRPSVPAVAYAPAPPPQQQQPPWPARHPPGFISHHPRRSASAGAEPWRGVVSFPPYSGASVTPKPGPSQAAVPVAVAVPYQPQASSPLAYQPQFAELSARRQQMQMAAQAQQEAGPSRGRGRRRSSRSRSRSTSRGSRGSSRSPEDAETTPRNASFRVPTVPVPMGVVMPSPAGVGVGVGGGMQRRYERELPPRAQHWTHHPPPPRRAGDVSQRVVEDLARLRMQDDNTPRAGERPQRQQQAFARPPPTQVQPPPPPTPPHVQPSPPRIEISPAEPVVTVKAR